MVYFARVAVGFWVATGFWGWLFGVFGFGLLVWWWLVVKVQFVVLLELVLGLRWVVCFGLVAVGFWVFVWRFVVAF